MRRSLGKKCFDLDVERNMSLFNKVYGDKEVYGAVARRIEENYDEIKRYAFLLLKGRWKALAKLPSIDVLSATALSLATAKLRFAERGMSEEIFFDTMSDIKIWGEDCRRHFGEIGLREINWIRLHIACRIFKIGRLQYQKSRYYLSAHAFGVISFGQKCFNIHIPRGGRLDREACVDSLRRAVDVFSKCFPKIRRDVMMCHSWLLGKPNACFIKKGSNIADFANLFEIVGETDRACDHFRWIFDINIADRVLQDNKRKKGFYYDLSEYSPNTSLQEGAKQYIMSGGQLKDGKGVIFVDKIINR